MSEASRPPSLTTHERYAIAALEKLERTWPKSLMIFANGNALSVRKVPKGRFPSPEFEVARITGIRNEGGDGGDES